MPVRETVLDPEESGDVIRSVALIGLSVSVVGWSVVLG